MRDRDKRVAELLWELPDQYVWTCAGMWLFICFSEDKGIMRFKETKGETEQKDMATKILRSINTGNIHVDTL